MVDDREPMSTDEILNEGRDPLVERHPRRKSPILLIVVIVAGIVAFNFLNQKVDDISGIIADSPLPPLINSTPASIHQAVSSANVSGLKTLLAEVDRDAINKVENGMTPIMLAAAGGSVEMIDLLFVHGADPNKRGSAKRTALQYATDKNHAAAAERLLNYGADIDAYDNGQLTPLIMAANRGYTELAIFLVDRGANVNLQHVEGWTALIDAVVKNDLKLARVLLKAGADKELKMKNGMKAIDYARQYQHKEMERLLSSSSISL